MTKDRRERKEFWIIKREHGSLRVDDKPDVVFDNIRERKFHVVELKETEAVYNKADVEGLLDALRFYADIGNPFPKQLDSDNEEVGHELDNDYFRGGKRAKQAWQMHHEFLKQAKLLGNKCPKP